MTDQMSQLSREEKGFDITAAAWRQFRTQMGWKGTMHHQDNYHATYRRGGLNSPPLTRKKPRAVGKRPSS